MSELKRIKPQPERPVSVHIGFWEGVNLGCAIWVGFAIASFFTAFPLYVIFVVFVSALTR